MSDTTKPIVCQLGIRNPTAEIRYFQTSNKNFSGPLVSRRLGKRNKDSGTRSRNESKYIFLFVRSIYLIVCLAGFCCKNGHQRVGHKDTGINAHTAL